MKTGARGGDLILGPAPVKPHWSARDAISDRVYR